MLYCDVMLAADDAFVQMPEIDVGMAGGMRLASDARAGRRGTETPKDGRGAKPACLSPS